MSAAELFKWGVVVVITVGIAFLVRYLVQGFGCIRDQYSDHNSPGLD